MIIYKVTNLVNGKVYIGMTIQSLAARKSKHLYLAFKCNSNIVFYKALRKYGKENFKWEVIDNAESEHELEEKEIYWIAFYNSFGVNGYNLTIGGEATRGYKHTEKSKKKMSMALSKNAMSRLENNPNVLLSKNDVLQIKELIKEGLSLTDISYKFNVNVSVIIKIKNGKTWKNVGEDVSGIKFPNKKLTNNQVMQIKELIKSGVKLKDIANVFNVSLDTISSIKLGKRWSDVGDDVSHIENPKLGRAKLTENDVRDIKLLFKEGKLSLKEIADKFNVHKSSIHKIKNGETWVNILI